MHLVPGFSFDGEVRRDSTPMIRIAAAAAVDVPLLRRVVGVKRRVCTMCTPCLSDWAVHRTEWGELAMSSGEWWNLGAWNPVRVAPRARHNPSSEGVLALSVD